MNQNTISTGLLLLFYCARHYPQLHKAYNDHSQKARFDILFFPSTFSNRILVEYMQK